MNSPIRSPSSEDSFHCGSTWEQGGAQGLYSQTAVPSVREKETSDTVIPILRPCLRGWEEISVSVRAQSAIRMLLQSHPTTTTTTHPEEVFVEWFVGVQATENEAATTPVQICS